MAPPTRIETAAQAAAAGANRSSPTGPHMIQSPQAIHIACRGVVHEAVAAWRREERTWTVEIVSPELGKVRADGADAFDALCAIREQSEPLGWRIGVAGAQEDVWPSGMSRDQGGGMTAYRMSRKGSEGRISTFLPVDPVTAVTLAEQRTHIDRLRADLIRGR